MLVTWLAARSDDGVFVVRNADNHEDKDFCLGQEQVEDVIGCMVEEGVRAVLVESL